MLFNAIGYSAVLFSVDKKFMDFRFRGIFAYIVLGVGVIQLLYPVNTPEDFTLVSNLALLSNIVAIVLPIMFIYIGIKTPKTSKYRNLAFIVAIGIIIYAIGSNLMVESIISSFELNIRIVIYFAFIILKLLGLSLFIFGVVKFIKGFSRSISDE